MSVSQIKQPSTAPLSLSIVVPVYNEETTVLEVLRKILSQKLPEQTEIIVVNDGSIDNSYELAHQFAQKQHIYSIKVISQKNQGKGSAVRAGVNAAVNEYILIQDADLEYSPDNYKDLISVAETGASVVYGSRLLKKNPISSWSFFLGGRLITFATNLLFGSKLTDEPTCYKLFRKEIYHHCEVRNDDFAWEPEFTAKVLKKGIPILEVPIDYYPRNIKEGKKIRWTDGLIALSVLLKEFINR